MPLPSQAEDTIISKGLTVSHRTMTAGIHLLAHVDAKILNHAFHGMDIPEEVPEIPIKRDVALALDDLAQKAYRHFVGNPEGWCHLSEQRKFIRNLVDATGDQAFLFDMGRYVKNEPEFNLIRGGFKMALTPYRALSLGMESAGRKFNRFLVSTVIDGGNDSVVAQIKYNNPEEVHELGDLFTLGVLTAGIEDFYVSLDELVISPLVSPFTPEREAEKVGLLEGRDIIRYEVPKNCEYKPDYGVHVYKLQWTRPNIGWIKSRCESIVVFLNGLYESGNKTRKGALQLQQSKALTHLNALHDDAEDANLAAAEARADAAEERAERIAVEEKRRRLLEAYNLRKAELDDSILRRQAWKESLGVVHDEKNSLGKVVKATREAQRSYLFYVAGFFPFSDDIAKELKKLSPIKIGKVFNDFEKYDLEYLMFRVDEENTKGNTAIADLIVDSIDQYFALGNALGDVILTAKTSQANLAELLRKPEIREDRVSFSYSTFWTDLASNFEVMYPNVGIDVDVAEVAITKRREELSVILANPLVNAVDAMGDEGAQISIRAYLSEPSKITTLIRNTGYKVPSDVIEKLNSGERFSTKGQGTGSGTQLLKDVGQDVIYTALDEGGLEVMFTMGIN